MKHRQEQHVGTSPGTWKTIPERVTNWDCCGSGPHATGDVRVLPYGGGGNLILCHACYLREIQYRISRNRDLSGIAVFALPAWADLKPYESEVTR